MLSNFKKSLLAIGIITLFSGCQDEDTTNPLDEPVDLVIVLGLQVNYETCTPRELLKYRVDRAYEVASHLKNPVFIASGKGNSTSVEVCDVDNTGRTEAAAIKDILTSKYDVNSNRIILEEHSTATTSNATEVKKVIDDMTEKGIEISSMQLVSSHYHVYRQGNCNDAICIFNGTFGDDTFDSSNSFTSSEFGPDQVWGHDFTINNGWQPDNSNIYLSDINGDKKQDIVAYKDSEVYIATSTGKQFNPAQLWASNFQPLNGNWPTEMKRMVGDVNGDGKGDLVAMMDDGIYVATTSDHGTANEMTLWTEQMSTDKGWDANKHPISVIDFDGNGYDDIVGFFNDGVYVAYSTGTAFADPVKVSDQFGLMSDIEQSNPGVTFEDDLNGSNVTNRLVGDVTGDGLVDIVIFGNDAKYVAVQKEDGSFANQEKWINTNEGDKDDFLNWSNDLYLKTVVDMTGNGIADIASIGKRDLFVAHSTGSSFEFLGGVTHYTSQSRTDEILAGWDSFVQDHVSEEWTNQSHFRLIGDVTGNGLNDLVGFSAEGMVVSENLHP